MSRIPYADPGKLSETVRTTLARAPINIMRMVANASEPVFNGFGQFSAGFYQPSELDPILREVVRDLRARTGADIVIDESVRPGLTVTADLGEVDWEQGLGWILWSFGGRPDYPELTDRPEFAARGEQA